MEIKEGIIVEGPFWPEPVEIKKVEDKRTFIHVIGSTIHSCSHIDQLISKDEIEKIKITSFFRDFSGAPDELFLTLEATRYKYASLFDPLLAMNVSKIDPLPFQIEAVYGYILQLPRIRYLIADDPGAGKTIMAGLIIKELKLRGVIKRILIVVPGHLKSQWIREIKEKFQESFEVMDRNSLITHYGENPWIKFDQVITSMDFAKQEEVLPSLASSHWDITIVDEAHKFSAYRYGEIKIEKSERYKLGETLSKISEHLLFLTATPHKGDPENFRLFIDLLEPGFFAKAELIEESIRNKDNPLFIRRLKEDMKDFQGRPIFKPRHVITVKFNLTDEEKDLYNELSRYVVTEYNKARGKDTNRNIAFALVILQRRMASSAYALLKSLQRRERRLDDLLKEAEIPRCSPELINFDELEEEEEKEEVERWKIENHWETITISENKEELKKEINTIKKLIEKAEDVIEKEVERKIIQLKKAIEEGFKKIKEVGANEKILIFTESKETMDYLYEKIKSWRYKVNYIHGGMSLQERVDAEKIFKHETQIMIATEAGGEGINLQFCNIMINYDIPWNPNRLEQRMGRIHRYGQQYDVYIYNLVAEDTREGEVLAKLFDKLEEIRKVLGSEKVFDVIGDVFFGGNLYQLICEAAINIRSSKDIIKEMDIKIDNEYISKIKEVLGESLATRYIDYTRISDIAEKAKEHRLIPEYIEEFFKKGLKKAGGAHRITRDGFIAIDSIPYEIKNIGNEIDFKNKYGILLKSYTKITFDKDIAFKNPDVEFVSFGHPLFEALLEWIGRTYVKNLQKGSLFFDPSGKYNGIIWFYECEVKDGTGATVGKKILSVYDDGKETKEINPAIIWDLIVSNSISNEKLEVPPLREEKIEELVIETVNKYKKELLDQRTKQVKIKEKYGVSSLEYLITKVDTELVELYERKNKGEKVELPIRNKEERKAHYQEALKKLKEQINKETNLILTTPKYISCVFVKSRAEEGLLIDEKIEKIGMEIVMKYERDNGRIPEDVSKENLGFDIRSKGKNEIRYIEVKTRSSEGDIDLTPNEWFKAKRFKEHYYLYIITNAVKNPQLHIIKNPAENLNPEEKIEIVRFIIRLEQWRDKTVVGKPSQSE